MADYDAIVIGAGHNGLVCAAYLARAGLQTLLVEARSEVGGCASTVDALGARINICNCDHITFRSTPVMDELGLAGHGLRYLDVEPGGLFVSWDGAPAWPIFHDVERTLEGLRLTHPDEVEGYRRYAQAAVPAAQLILAAAAEPPSTRSLLAKVIDRRGAGAATVLRWSRMSAADVVRRYFHSEALLAPALALGPVVWGMSPEAPGTGLGALTYALRHAGAVGRPVGGSGMVPAALLAAFEANGGTVRTRWPVTAINCTSAGVAGVVVGDDTEITARTVVSACDPHRTFLTWLRNPPAGAGPMIERWRTTALHDGYESKLDGLVSSLPTYRSLDPALADRLGFDPMHPTTHVSPPVADIVSGAAMLAQGKVMERPVFYANFPSALDPSMAPEGRHVFSLETLYTPYALPGGWPRSSEPRRWLEQYATLVEPGFLDGLGEWRAMTPDVYEGSFFLPKGHATSFAGGPLAALRSRQPELTRYRTPISGLYLTGAATFPGAGVWGASGRNCALTILARR